MLVKIHALVYIKLSEITVNAADLRMEAGNDEQWREQEVYNR